MLTSTFVWIGILVALGVLLVREEEIRTWRTVTLLLLGAASVWGLQIWDPPWAILAQAVVTTAIAIVYFALNRPLWALCVADHRFADAYVAMVRGLSGLRRQASRLTQSEYLRRFEAITERLRAAPAPSADWRALQAETLKDLDDRLSHLRRLEASDEELERFENRWKELVAGYTILYRAKASFWRSWP